MVKYDDAAWHSGGDFPADLPAKAAATHIGIFLAWAILRDHASDALSSHKTKLSSFKTLPGELVIEECDGKLLPEDLNDEGNHFASYYYNINKCIYYIDLNRVFGNFFTSLYYIPDSWKTFSEIAPTIDQRFEVFQK